VAKLFGLCVAFAAVLLLSVCASSGSARSHGTGRLVGAILFSGRVPHGASGNRYQRGWVVVSTRDEHRVAKQWVKVNHKYHFTLAPGTYVIASHDRWANCRNTAHIKAGRTTDQNVYCNWH
jgi:hypothetical protein